MARFIRILVGDGRLPFALNLDAIESVDFVNHRVYTVGAAGGDAYHISDDGDWERILSFVRDNTDVNY